MNGALRTAAARVARTGMLPLLPAERLLGIERVAAGLEGRVRRVAPPAALDPRRLRTGWAEGDLLVRALAAHRRSLDRAIVEAWLLDGPTGHPAAPALAAAAGHAAERHDWRWRAAGRRWRLWDGPETLRAAPDREAALVAAGLTGRLGRGAFACAVRGDDA